jgi:hypothetical protein
MFPLLLLAAVLLDDAVLFDSSHFVQQGQVRFAQKLGFFA